MLSADFLPLAVVIAAVLFVFYTYAGYPALLWVLGRFKRRGAAPGADRSRWPRSPDEWPLVSITVPAYNEAAQIRELIESLLAIDYPRERLEILIVSDGSTDGTDDIVREYEDRGVDLLRMDERGGKTRAENAAAKRLRGEIVVNTDASIRIDPKALKPMIAAFEDPEIGLASGRDVSVPPGSSPRDWEEGGADTGESGYVGYEMGVRDLETRVAGIIGASGCFYAIRVDLHRIPLPESLSRDFAAALHTIEHGYRPVSVPSAVCYVPRTASLHKEFQRKVRTITRGMETLQYKKSLLNPLRYGVFSWMLWSHKIARWLLPWAGFAAFVAMGFLALGNPVALVLFLLGAVVLAIAGFGWMAADRIRLPTFVSLPTFLVSGNLAAMKALLKASRGDRHAMWEPTRREAVS